MTTRVCAQSEPDGGQFVVCTSRGNVRILDDCSTSSYCYNNMDLATVDITSQHVKRQILINPHNELDVVYKHRDGRLVSDDQQQIKTLLVHKDVQLLNDGFILQVM